MKIVQFLVTSYPIPNLGGGKPQELTPPQGADPAPFWIGTFSEHDRPALVVFWKYEREQPVQSIPTIPSLIGKKE